jgi:hypothetical protein
MAPPLPRFVSYLRVSTDGQGRSGLGLEAQRQAVASHVAAAGGEVVAEWPELTKRASGTHKQTYRERQAALRMGSGIARSGRNPSVFSDIFCCPLQT